MDVLVRLKLAGVGTPATAAVTAYDPAVALAVNTAEVATPDVFVVAVFTPPAKLPLAPLPGAVNVTTTPATGLLLLSLTVATSGVAKAVPMVALCGVPLVAMIELGGPALIVMLSGFEVLPLTSVTDTVKLEVLAVDGVPLMVPAEEMVRPVGNPEATLKPGAEHPEVAILCV